MVHVAECPFIVRTEYWYVVIEFSIEFWRVLVENLWFHVNSANPVEYEEPISELVVCLWFFTMLQMITTS